MEEDEVPLVVHYPKLNEKITSVEYTFRIMTRLPGPVEISVDGNAWQRCRPAVGYWWYDWRCDFDGNHDILARVFDEEGRIEQTAPRSFIVECDEKAPSRE